MYKALNKIDYLWYLWFHELGFCGSVARCSRLVLAHYKITFPETVAVPRENDVAFAEQYT
jgi:hypothetical protein